MINFELSEKVIQSVSDGFFSMLTDVFDVDVEISPEELKLVERFSPHGDTVVHIDYVGSVVGLVAISASREVFGACFDIGSFENSGMDEETYANELAGPLKECMNTVAGKCLPILAGQISCVSMLAPKVLFGYVLYPKTPCLEKKVVTNFGDLHFHFYIDRMKLDTAKAIERLELSETSTKSAIESMEVLYQGLESTQLQVLSEVGDTIEHIRNLKSVIEGEEEEGGSISDEACSALNNLENTQELMSKRISDIVHDLNMFKGMLLHDLRVTKVTESDLLREVNLVGCLSERSNLNFFSDNKSGYLVVNVDNIYNHNIAGVNMWIRAISRCADSLRIEFVRCSSHFLGIAQQHKDLLGQGSVRSLSAHYFCPSCEFKEQFEFHLDQLDRQMDVPEVECNCGCSMTLWEGCDQSALVKFLTERNSGDDEDDDVDSDENFAFSP